MPRFFFQCFWDILGAKIVKFYDNFVVSGSLPKGSNKTQIVLIRKKTKLESMEDLRSISLCNVIYKIASKVLANRLKSLLNPLILETQSAFVLGRIVIDNTMVAYEIHHYLNRKTQGKTGYVAIKLYMSKAYDRVEWGLLEGIMITMGFDTRWIKLMKEYITTVEYNILVEGAEWVV